LWQRERSLASALLKELPQIEEAASSVRGMLEMLLRVAAEGTLDDAGRKILVDAFPTGSAITPRRAAFNAQLRVEVYLVAGEEDHAIDAMLDAAANVLLDVEWLDRCSLLDAIRERPELRGVRRSTALRAARVREALDAR
jgi:hypothetical protein